MYVRVLCHSAKSDITGSFQAYVGAVCLLTQTNKLCYIKFVLGRFLNTRAHNYTARPACLPIYDYSLDKIDVFTLCATVQLSAN